MIGIDIVEIERVNADVLKKIAHQSEIDYVLQNKSQSLQNQKIAALFAVKESVMKALGLGIDSGGLFKDILLSHDELGKPNVTLFGRAKQTLESLYPGKNVSISISHTNLVAVAVAIIV